MVIHRPKTTQDKTHVTITAPVSWESQCELPTTLWYRLPREHEGLVSDSCDAFLVPLLPVAMFFRESVLVEGPTSSQLVYNAREYQRVLHFWHPEWFTPVSTTYSSIIHGSARQQEGGVLCTYSGGVDSTYTLFSHLPRREPQPDAQVTHAVFIKSFSFPKHDPETDHAKMKAFSTLSKELNVQFVPVETNAKQFHNFNNVLAMYMTFSAVIGGVALALQKGISRFYFSSDNTHDYALYSTINHTLVPLFASNQLDVIVHGASTSKFEKLKELSTHKETHDCLVCCWEHPDHMRNCGECVKCSLIITALDMQGLLHLYTTFPNKINRWKVRTRIYTKDFFHFPKTWIRYAIEKHRWDVAFDFTCTLFLSWLHELFNPVLSGDMVRYIRDPREVFYKASYLLKHYSPLYRRVVERSKIT